MSQPTGNHWYYCDHCERDTVICGKCGNNTCNGGYGLVDGVKCDQCPSAYQMQANAPLTLEQYVDTLEAKVDPQLVAQFEYFPLETKLYLYLHNIQLDAMTEFKKLLSNFTNTHKL